MHYNIYCFLDPDFAGNISGDVYPPTQFAQICASIASFLWLGGIALLMAGTQLFQAMGIPEPEFYKLMKANGLATFVLLFLVNNIGSSMIATGTYHRRLVI